MYIPLTHLERWIPLASAVLYLMLMGYALLAPVDKKEQQSTQQQAQSAPQQQQKPAAPQKTQP